MASNRYTVYYTDVTFHLIKKLETEGHNQRDIINAGIVLFSQANDQERGLSHMTAYNKPTERLQNALHTLHNVDIKFLSPEEAELVKQLRSFLKPGGHPSVSRALKHHTSARKSSVASGKEGKEGSSGNDSHSHTAAG